MAGATSGHDYQNQRIQESRRNLLGAHVTTTVSQGPAAVVHSNYDSRRWLLSSLKVTRQTCFPAIHRTRRSNPARRFFRSNWSRRF